jgi:DNA-binding transcriptional MerR regulator
MTCTIGRLARLANVSVETIRYYERRSLLEPVPRTRSGYRVYPPSTVERIRFIKEAQALGLSLADVKEILAGFDPGRGPDCRRVHDLLARHLTELEARVRALQALRSTLLRHVEACARTLTAGRDEPCPTVDALEGLRR